MFFKNWLVIALSGLVAAEDCVNAPDSRNCWRDGFDINTDYTDPANVPSGKLVEYDLTVAQQIITPDGYERLGTVFNGQYPGPTIEADWGDTLRITVRNNLTNNDNGTAVHWHGIRLFETNWLDGVPGVTQCPISRPIHIHGPTSANWDIDLGPWTITDWYHDDAFTLNWISLAGQLAPFPKSSLLNGKGVYECDPESDSRCTGKQDYFEQILQSGTRYKVGLINTATLLTYSFWIDGHNFTVIASDFVPIEPYKTSKLNIGMGQRYDIIIEANADFVNGSNFWIHAEYCAEAGVIDNTKVGIIRYNANNTAEPYTPAPTDDYKCADILPSNLVPVVSKSVGPKANDLDIKDYLTVGEVNKLPSPWILDPRVHLWTIKTTPLYIDWEVPSIVKLTAGDDSTINTLFPAQTVPIELEFETGEWVYFVITANYSVEDVVTPRNLTPSVHPIHLHGHDFAILAQGHGEFTDDVEPNLVNPPRRDVINVDINGWAWIAFQIDNPGAWLMHCHLQFHSSEGMGLQFIEQRSKIRGLAERADVLGELSDRCESWSDWYQSKNIPDNSIQEDSGI
ncbi:hypothetical protein N7520_004248 [Penicillium odoratum]|uniref:uncharacterized protein n=1 Tax=Penicillium odoratum TaxID=1167516 RepID=UPI002547EA0A|nr:uncharacterized protein N7520_004248 [Penicillium odoratum]KAJ5769689.1 hypothetical protein N7520_004248 [Penicillium odoratum]